jgi:hypothetical protein
MYSSPDIINMIKSRRVRWAGHVAFMWQMRNLLKTVVDCTERKRPLTMPSRRREGNVKLDPKLRKLGQGCGLD